MPGMRHLWLVTLSLALLLLSAEFASPQQQDEHTFPTKDQIDFLLTQSDRAFEMYEQSLKQEAQMGEGWEKAVAKDREVLVNARDLIARLKKSPDGFNGPAGFLLVGGLEDADRNMSLCMGQAGMQSATRGCQATSPKAKGICVSHRLVWIRRRCSSQCLRLHSTCTVTIFSLSTE